MSNQHNKPAAEAVTPLSAEVKLQIYQSVEERLAKLPAETFKLIQNEVDNRVKIVERHYVRLATVVFVCLSVVMVVFFKITRDTAAEAAAKAIASAEVKKQVDIIEKLFLESQETKNRLVLAAVDGLNAGESLKARLKELEKLDNLVTYGLGGTLTLKPIDGKVRIRGTANSEIDLLVSTNGFDLMEIPPTADRPPKLLKVLMAD